MGQVVLPGAFTEEMERILGSEYPAFLASYDQPARKGLRVNTRKISPERFLVLAEEAGFHLTPVPWTRNGFFCEEGDQPSRHPAYSAGLYYLQEPSAMAPAQLLPVEPGDRVLDLCAAPGGKATELGTRLQGKGFLLANEISPARARALVRNVELFGIPNACITSASPDRLLDKYPAFFDKILVDAPCSGEGMFRKDQGAIDTWSPDKVRECARIQRKILVEAADMLRPGGFLVYSTCTFAPRENELSVLHLLAERADMELAEIPREGGRADFAPGMSLERLRELGYLDEETWSDGKTGQSGEEASRPDREAAYLWPSAEQLPDLTRTCRLWPHKIEGEGHFLALLRKKVSGLKTDDLTNYPADGLSEQTEKVPAVQTGDRGGSRNLSFWKIRENRTDKRKAGKGKPEACRQERLSAEEIRLMKAFLSPYLERSPEEAAFCVREDVLEVHKGQVYLMPEGMHREQGIQTLRAGLYLGELKKDRFEPAQELALALPSRQQVKQEEDQDGAYVCLNPEDARLQSYLRGQTIQVIQTGQNGWRLLCAGPFPIGWGKLVNGQLKNKYPTGWRIPN